MTKIVLLTATVLIALSAPALAEKRWNPYSKGNQVYNPYDIGNMAANQQQFQPNTYRVYPGREQYGQSFGSIPRHPGDYRDAVDRGSWSGGGVGSGGVGSRSFDVR